MKRQIPPDPDLANHQATMAMLKERAGGDPAALEEIEEWGCRREKRLPVLSGFAQLLARHGVINKEMDRADRDYVIAQCYAIATKHGLDMMDYVYNDAISGPLASLMSIDLHAVEIGDPCAENLFPTSAKEQAFLEEVKDVPLVELGRMAREAAIAPRDRVILA